MRHGLRLVWNVVGDPEERASAAVVRPAPDLRTRLHDVADRTVGNADSRAFVVRLTLCMTIAEVARQVVPLDRPYWVVLTVAIVLKPDLGSVFTRAVHRGVGTLLGVLIGSLLLTVVPRDAWVLVPMALAAGALPWARRPSPEHEAREILATRFASGDLSSDEFLERASVLNWTPGVEPLPVRRGRRR